MPAFDAAPKTKIMPARTWRIIPLLALATAACGSGTDSVSNAEMHTAIEQAWSRPTLGLLLGPVRFIERGAGVQRAEISKGEDLITELPLYRAAAANKLITMTESQGIYLIVATDSGARRGTIAKVGTADELLVRINRARIETITSNDSLMAGGDRYQIVQGTSTLDIDEDFKAAYLEARGDTLPRDRRFKALLQYDPISSSWTYLTADFGSRTGEFATPVIDRMVAALRQCGKTTC